MTALFDWYWRLLHLVKKELWVIFKDPSNRIILAVPALIESLLFGYAATYDLNHVPYALLNQSQSQIARDFVTRLEAPGIFQRIANLNSSAQIGQQIDSGRAAAVIYIPQDFERQWQQGSAQLQVIVDGRNSTSAAAAGAYVSAVAASIAPADNALELVTRAWGNPNLETRWNMLSGMIASLSMLQTMMLAALSVAREREQGTFDQMLVTPYSPLDIMIGKAIPAILIGLVQSTVVLLVTLFWFQVPLGGSLALIYAGLLIFTTASVGIGLCLSAYAQNMQQAMLYTFILIMPLVLLSGLTTPVRNMPEFLQIATYINPLRFAIDLLQRVYVEGAGLLDVAHNFVPLLIMIAISLPLASWLFRHRLV